MRVQKGLCRSWMVQESSGESERVRESPIGSLWSLFSPGGSGSVREGPGGSGRVREGPGGSGRFQ